MKIIVIGGSGLIGTKLVRALREQGHEAVAASPKSGVNALTGEGLAPALEGAAVVIDVSNAPSWEAAAVMKFFLTSTHNLLDAEAAAGVQHHIALSVVGAERMPGNTYMPAKIAQEATIQDGPIPYTIGRATQFFEFVGAVADSGTIDGTVRLPPIDFQPIAADDVAAISSRHCRRGAVERHHRNRRPERKPLEQLRRLFAARKDPRRVVTAANALYFEAEVDDRSLTPQSQARLGKIHFEDWLARN